ncbi:MAG: PP2C family protein-serine/threonine phosphatase [Phycisphaerales bacterium]
MARPDALERPDSVYAGAPVRWIIAFFGGVACIFAPIGVLFGSSIMPDRSLRSFLIICAVSGALAVCWAAAFTVSKKFIAGIVLCTALMMAINIPAIGGRMGLEFGRPSLDSFLIIGLLVAGYVLLVLFITVQGRRTISLQQEMRLARQIHDALVPDLALRTPNLEVCALSTPSSAMGGDLVDLVERESCTDLCLADVSGHGVRAGVVMGMLKASMRAELRRDQPLGDLVTALNETLASITPSDVFATMVWLRIPQGAHEVECCIAGHHPALLIRDGSIERVGNDHLPLGIVAEERYDSRRLPVRSGDLIACYTDGLTETADRANLHFGIERVDEAIRELADQPLSDIAETVLARVRAHGPQGDDQSMLLVRIG